MEIDFETWKKLVEDAKITKVKLMRPNSIFIEFDTGMLCYLYASTPLKFDFNWLEGYGFLSNKALEIYMEDMLKK